MKCSDCFHQCVCGSASIYCDASQCKTFVDRRNVVSQDVLSSVQDACERLREEVRDFKLENERLEACFAEMEEEIARLRIIKQTLEMSSGLKFDF